MTWGSPLRWKYTNSDYRTTFTALLRIPQEHKPLIGGQLRATSGSCKLKDLRTWGNLLPAKVYHVVSRIACSPWFQPWLAFAFLSLSWSCFSFPRFKGFQWDPCLSLGNCRLAVMRLSSIIYITKTNTKNESKLSNLANLTDFSFQIKAINKIVTESAKPMKTQITIFLKLLMYQHLQ